MSCVTGHPVDHGWAWIVAFAGQVIMFILCGLYTTSGIIIIEALDTFGVSTTKMAFVIAVSDVIYTVAGLFTLGVLSDLVHTRVQIMIGGFLMFLGYSICFFASNVDFLFAYSVSIGCGFSLVWYQTAVVVSQYFERHKALAIGIVMSGSGIGNIILPFIIKALLDQYSLRGTLLILGAICLNIVVLGSLMRPVEFFHRACSECIQSFIKNDNKSTQYLQNDNISPENSQFIDNQIKDNELSVDVSDCLTPKTDIRNSTGKKSCALKQLEKNKHSSFNFFIRKIEFRNSIKIIDIDLLKNKAFVSYQIGVSILLASNHLHVIFMALLSRQHLHLGDVTILISIYGVFSFISRFSIGALGDCGIIQRYKIILICVTLLGVYNQFTRSFTTFWPLAVFFAVSGYLNSSFHVLSPVTVIDFFGRSFQSRSLGITLTLSGALIFATTPVLGYLSDLTGTHDASFNIIGALHILGCFIWAFVTVPLWKRTHRPQVAESNKDQSCPLPL